MEYGSIERELHIDASPEVVFEVVSSPVHILQWWDAETDLEPVAGATGELVWRNNATSEATFVPITVVDAKPPRLFTFRWCHSRGEIANPANSLLVTFELIPAGAGTVLRMTERGFREMGWEAAVLEQHYQEHCVGWDTHLARIASHARALVSTP